jgi:uncharacterized membrane protein
VLSRRLQMEAQRVRDRIERGDPFWPAQVAVAIAVLLGLLLADPLTIGPRWLLPGIEGALFVVLVIVVPRRATKHSRGRRTFALCVIGLVSAATIYSLARLVHFLVSGGDVGGERLIESGAVIWVTNVLLFGVWYWELDRGGPVARHLHPEAMADFQFPQMDPDVGMQDWRPGFGDYLYTSLTNSVAFSPTDTLPLTQTAKAVMAVQSIVALLTVLLVVARAVNILG